jgi:hypothetical protein
LLSHRLRVAALVEGFVGFAVGRSMWEDAIAAHRRGELDDASAVTVISQEYLRYAYLYCTCDPELVGREHVTTVLTALARTGELEQCAGRDGPPDPAGDMYRGDARR